MDLRGPVRVGTALPLDWRSGHEYLLAALDRVRAAGHGLKVDLPDGGPDRERVLFTVHDLGLADFVALHPASTSTPPPDVRVIAPLDDTVLAPGTELAGGLVVATDRPRLRELLAARPHTRFVPSRDVGALAAALVAAVGEATT